MSDEAELSNVFSAHVLPRRMEGDTQLIDIALFNPDKSPFALPVIPEQEITGDWIKLSDAQMAHGYKSLGEGYEVRYRRRPDGFVEFRGYLKPGQAGETVFTLPEGYRPTDLDYM